MTTKPKFGDAPKECICSDGFGMNLSCPVHSADRAASSLSEVAPLSVEQLKKEWLAQSEILDYSNWLMARVGVLSAKVKELEAQLAQKEK